MFKSSWSSHEMDNLFKFYPTESKSQLLKLFPNRSWRTILSRARYVGVKRLYPHQEWVKYDTSVLLHDTPEAFYWMGFLLADAYIGENNVINLTLAIKDADHVKRFATFIKHPNVVLRPSTAGVCTRDSRWASKIRSKFDIRPPKTYNPPSLCFYETISDSLFIALLAGFIDGDGHIHLPNEGSRTSMCKIKNHGSWIDFHRLLSRRLSRQYGTETYLPALDAYGYSQFYISHPLLRRIKYDAQCMNLPLLVRKWDKVEVNLLTRNERREVNKRQIEILVKNGFKTPEIADRLNLSKDMVREIRCILFTEGRVSHSCDTPSLSRRIKDSPLDKMYQAMSNGV